jgi:hypothetical protein
MTVCTHESLAIVSLVAEMRLDDGESKFRETQKAPGN